MIMLFFYGGPKVHVLRDRDIVQRDIVYPGLAGIVR